MSLSVPSLSEPEVRIRQVSSSSISISNGPRQKDDASHHTHIHVHTQPSAPTHHRSASPAPSHHSLAAPQPTPTPSSSPHPSGSPYYLLLVFLLVLLLVALVISRLPRLTPDEWSKLQLPRTQSDVLALSHTLARYRQEHFASVVFLFCLLYVFLQSFAIPGPVLLSFASGPLFGFRFALVLVSLSATAGACSCYWLSFFLARSSVERCFPSLLSSFRAKIDSNRDTLTYTLIALRISPLLPNWFINISSPHLHVPFLTFLLATLIGLIPANYIHVSTGLQVEGLTGGGGGWMETVWRMAGLCLLALVALLPTLWAKRQKAEAERSSAKSE